MSANLYLDAALTYARAGIPVFRCTFPVNYPAGRGCSCRRRKHCDSPAKHPIEKGGFHNATTNPALIEQVWKRSSCNIGIATGAISGLVVLDVDPRHSGDETLAQLEARYGELPTTWRFLTGGGGEHIVFAHPGGHFKSQSGALGPGLDIKADGGYIIAPPSRHISGRRYEISVDHHPEDLPLSPLPTKAMFNADGTARRDASGKIKYSPRVSIADKTARERFEAAARAVLRRLLGSRP